ncbi:MAG: PepSY domain-containing protein [Methylohalobius sp. ZOD2]
MRTLIFAALFGLSTSVLAEELRFEDLPKGVQETFKQAHPNARDVEVEKEAEEYGEPLYEIEFEADGVEYEALYHTDGSFFGYEREFPRGLLPQAVKDSIAKRFPQGEIQATEVVVNAEDEPLAYEVKIKDNGEEWEAYFNADGSFINQLKD